MAVVVTILLMPSLLIHITFLALLSIQVFNFWFLGGSDHLWILLKVNLNKNTWKSSIRVCWVVIIHLYLPKMKGLIKSQLVLVFGVLYVPRFFPSPWRQKDLLLSKPLSSIGPPLMQPYFWPCISSDCLRRFSLVNSLRRGLGRHLHKHRKGILEPLAYRFWDSLKPQDRFLYANHLK
jgi:hypothetical protein